MKFLLRAAPSALIIYALDVTTGAEVWKATIGRFASPSPAVVNGVVYAASDEDTVYAIGNQPTPTTLTATTTGNH